MSEKERASFAVWFGVCFIFAFLALELYVVARKKAGEGFALSSRGEKLRAILLHVRDESAPAWPHVVGNLCLAMAGCVLVGMLSAWITDGKALEKTGIGLSAGALLLSVFSACATLWTLWQTQRIELHVGYSTKDFGEIVRSMSRDIEKLARDIQSTELSVRTMDRVLIVAQQPFYGMLTFVGKAEETLFTRALFEAARAAEFGLTFHILCGDENVMHAFHAEYYKRLKFADDIESRVALADSQSRKYIDQLEAVAKDAIVRTTLARIPQAEFVIVGNTVYEFSIDTSSGRSVATDTHIRQGPNAAVRYAKIFSLIVAAANAPQPVSRVDGAVVTA